MLKNPVNKYVLIGSFFRAFAGAIITYYLPVFFLRTYPDFKSQFSYVNSVILVFGSFISGLVAGAMSDIFEAKSKMTKAYICLAGCILGFPLIAISTLQTTNFWLSMTCFCISTFFTSAFTAQAVTMM